MLRSLKQLETYSVHALDGDLGKLDQLFFEDDRWLVRYLVIKTGRFMNRSKILISTHGLKKIDWPTQRFEVAVTKDQIEHSPEIQADAPPARSQELDYLNYYKWPFYWAGNGIWGVAPLEVVPGEIEKADPHLRSTQSALECKVEAMGKPLGRIVDLWVDDDRWNIKYLVIDSGELRESERMLVPTDQIAGIDWSSRVMSCEIPLEFFASSPVYYPMAPLTRDFEQRLKNHYHPSKKAS